MIYIRHAIMALIAQAAIGFPTGNWWAGAMLGSAYFIGREVAQAEYRWIEWFGGGLRANMPHWGRFDPRVWPKLDQWLDWIAPTVATCAVAACMTQ
nr:hypothetical protein [Sphingobium sp. WCS2017Hpa-17]